MATVQDSTNVVLTAYQKEGCYFITFEGLELKLPKEVFEKIMAKVRFKPIIDVTTERKTFSFDKPIPVGWIVWGKSNAQAVEY